ncbi:Reverse transcriptase-like [Sesbania bispinosa]|nr:Reverse transcriptase-like [Sesbania bispinosa]
MVILCDLGNEEDRVFVYGSTFFSFSNPSTSSIEDEGEQRFGPRFRSHNSISRLLIELPRVHNPRLREVFAFGLYLVAEIENESSDSDLSIDSLIEYNNIKPTYAGLLLMARNPCSHQGRVRGSRAQPTRTQPARNRSTRIINTEFDPSLSYTGRYDWVYEQVLTTPSIVTQDEVDAYLSSLEGDPIIQMSASGEDVRVCHRPEMHLLSRFDICPDNFILPVGGESLGNVSILEAEIWGLIREGCCSSHTCSGLVLQLQEAAKAFDQVLWKHVFRESNSLADVFAKEGLNASLWLRVFDTIPSFALLPFLFDFSSAWHERGG